MWSNSSGITLIYSVCIFELLIYLLLIFFTKNFICFNRILFEDKDYSIHHNESFLYRIGHQYFNASECAQFKTICTSIFLEREQCITDIGAQLQIFDCEFWSSYDLYIVPMVDSWKTLWNPIDLAMDVVNSSNDLSEHCILVLPLILRKNFDHHVQS